MTKVYFWNCRVTFFSLLNMSSTIDAAIIKALVEHIGGNPDSIPDGPIGGSGSNTLSFRYEPLDLHYEKSNKNLYVNKILPTMFVIGHTALRLKRENSNVIDTYICVNHYMSIGDIIYMEFAPIVNDNPFHPSSDESEHLTFNITHFGDEDYTINIEMKNADFEQPSPGTSTGLCMLVVEGEPDNVRTLRENYVKTEIVMNRLTCSLMACMHATNVSNDNFKIYN